MNLAERIKLVLNETGLNKSQFASKIKVTPATVAYWCSGRTKHLRGDYASRISRVFGYATFWLSEGQGPKMINQNESGFPLVSALDTERIPLIKIEDVEDKTKWKNDSFILTDLDMSSGSFAVEIKDSSMSPAFNIGDRVIFDPELTAGPGDYVIVKVRDETPVFRKLKVLGFSEDLKPVLELKVSLMLNNTENNLPIWFFFSDVDATAINESARKLLVWSGENFGPLFSAADNILNAMMVPGHRLSKESVIELIALLGASFGSNPCPSPSARELFTDAIMILSYKLSELPREEV